jgi:hypothetical protein
MVGCSHGCLLGDSTMKKLAKHIWAAIVAAKQIRARAVVAGAHWY